MENASDARAESLNIVLAEDDPDDRLFTRRALKENDLPHTLHTVEDGEELLDFLYRRGRHAEREGPLPDLVLLDLNMPRMDGRETLRQMKGDDELRRIPVIVLTTSRAEQDVIESYDLGVNAFVTKPVTFEDLVEAFRQLSGFWFDVVRLPK